MASKSTPPPTLLHLYPCLSAALFTFSRFFHFIFSPAASQYTFAEPRESYALLQIWSENITSGQTGLISKTNLCSLINSIQRVHPQVRASQRTKKQVVPELFCLGAALQMTSLIERNKGRLMVERKINCEYSCRETSWKGNRD